MHHSTSFDHPARKAPDFLGGSPALLGGHPDLSSPRQSREYIRMSKAIYRLVSAKAAVGGTGGDAPGAAATGTATAAVSIPVGNTGITSNVSIARTV